jgi:hypothetical protein
LEGFRRYRCLWLFFDKWMRDIGWARRCVLTGALPAGDEFYCSEAPSGVAP